MTTTMTTTTTSDLVQEAANLPRINNKYKFGLFRSRSDIQIRCPTTPVASRPKPRRVLSYGGESAVSSPCNQQDVSIMSDMSTQLSTSLQAQRSRSESKLFPQLESRSANKQTKRESLKAQKKTYRREKKRAARELLCTLKDPSVIVIADWLKIRGSLKGWTKLWCVLKPGLLVLYKSHKQKSGHWVGTVLLNACELIERPSKKDGFCFKLFHALDMSIWATKGPKGENLGAITQPLPYSYLIFRAPSEQAGKCWMDALELALRCSSLLMRVMSKDTRGGVINEGEEQSVASASNDSTFESPLRQEMNESDCERHFKGYDLEDDSRVDERDEKSDSESDHSDHSDEKEMFDEDLVPIETPYEENAAEELGQQGDACQTEEVADENKSLIWSLVKQVRPGMDLSKVVLPTFILEPRSFLDKLADYYYHSDFLSEAVKQEDPYTRIKSIVRWYISGFYKKPKGLKKPYNPILGETFRCYWKHPQTNSRTFYIAEQISHHPPVSVFYITNRQDGFSASGTVLAKSKFYGNSISAILDGVGRLTLLKRGEDYLITMPYAHCKGILIGTLTMEMGGKVSLVCEKTGYRADLEFKLKPFLGMGEASNKLIGKIKLGGETLASIDGHWDQEVFIKEKHSGETELFWNPTPEVRTQRLKRYTVPIDAQGEFESERLWQHVSAAIVLADQQIATAEKYKLEEAQRRSTKARRAKMEDWTPALFEQSPLTDEWQYKYADLRPWDSLNDVLQYELDFVVQTKTRHRTPIVRTTSVTNVDRQPVARPGAGHKNRCGSEKVSGTSGVVGERESGSSTPDVLLEGDSDSSESRIAKRRSMNVSLQRSLEPLTAMQRRSSAKLASIESQLTVVQRELRHVTRTWGEVTSSTMVTTRDISLVTLVLVCQALLMWLFK